MPTAAKSRKPIPVPTTRTVPVSKFKAHCLAMVNGVRNGQGEIILTNHNQPIAKIVPIEPIKRIPLIGSAEGFFTVAEGHDLVAPMAPDWQWGDDI